MGVSRIHAVEQDPRHLPQDSSEISRRRYVAKLLGAIRRTGDDLARVERRSLAPNRDCLGGSGDGHRDLDDRVPADLDHDLAPPREEAVAGELERVGARREAEKTKVAVSSGGGLPSGVRSGERRRRPRDRRSLLVERRAVDVPGRRRNLSSGQRRKQRRHHRRDAGRSRFHIRPERCSESGTGCPEVSTRGTPRAPRLTARSGSLRRRRRTRGRSGRSARNAGACAAVVAASASEGRRKVRARALVGRGGLTPTMKSSPKFSPAVPSDGAKGSVLPSNQSATHSRTLPTMS